MGQKRLVQEYREKQDTPEQNPTKEVSKGMDR